MNVCSPQSVSESLLQGKIQNIYFLGIGGIGMSALARFFSRTGYSVAGYDRSLSTLTQELEKEGIRVATGGWKAVDPAWNSRNTLVVRTPAVPVDDPACRWFESAGYPLVKRAELLGEVTRAKRALCVAGTHGKTTCSTMLAHIMHGSEKGANAFLGGISLNYKSNVLIDAKSDYVVVEADEYDRSFHHLRPYMSLITCIEPDHLDIYGNAAAYQEAFNRYASLVQEAVVVKKGYAVEGCSCRVYTYSAEEKADFYADNIRCGNGTVTFDFHAPARCGESVESSVIADMELGVPVWVNIENAVGAMSIAWLNGVSEACLREGLRTYSGVHRRFNRLLNKDGLVYIDDYAHHPTEIRTAIRSVRRVYEDYGKGMKWRLLVVFQPHLYSRTRDFMDAFADALNEADEVVLLPVYPAREKPIAGVTSEVLADRINSKRQQPDCRVVEKAELPGYLATRIVRPMVVMTLGAGDIDRLTGQLIIDN